MKKIYNHWNICDSKNKVLVAQKKIKDLNEAKFSEKDMRGLTKIEKDFVKNNNYNIALNQYNIIDKKVKYYLLIKRNNLGKKELYAVEKKQVLRPNHSDICKGFWNHEILLKFNLGQFAFSRFNFEKSVTVNSILTKNVIIHLF